MTSRRGQHNALGLVITALLLLAAVPAMAQAVTLHETNAGGPALLPTQAVTGFSETLTFNAGLAVLECAESEVNGEVLTNGPATGIINTARFQGAGGNPECATSLSAFGVTAIITPTGLPWPIKFFANAMGEGRTKIKGYPEVGFIGEILLNGSPLTTCEYAKKKVWDEFAFGAPLGDVVPAQQFTLASESPALGLCEAEGTLEGEFTITTGGEPVVVVPGGPDATQLCKVQPEEIDGELVCPSGQGYSGKIESELESSTTFESESAELEGTITCTSGSLTGEFNEDGTSPAGGGITGLALTGPSGAPCSSSFSEGSEVEVEFEGLPYDSSQIFYEQAPSPQGSMAIGATSSTPQLSLSWPKIKTCLYVITGVDVEVEFLIKTVWVLHLELWKEIPISMPPKCVKMKTRKMEFNPWKRFGHLGGLYLAE